MTVPVSWYLALAAALFGIGTLGVLSRRSAITAFLSIELMLNAVNLSIVAFGRSLGNRGDMAAVLDGQVLVLMVIAVAAAEAAVGLALFIAVYRRRRTIDLNRLNLMRW